MPTLRRRRQKAVEIAQAIRLQYMQPLSPPVPNLVIPGQRNPSIANTHTPAPWIKM